MLTCGQFWVVNKNLSYCSLRSMCGKCSSSGVADSRFLCGEFKCRCTIIGMYWWLKKVLTVRSFGFVLDWSLLCSYSTWTERVSAMSFLRLNGIELQQLYIQSPVKVQKILCVIRESLLLSYYLKLFIVCLAAVTTQTMAAKQTKLVIHSS